MTQSGGRARLLVEKSGDITVVYFQDAGILDEKNINKIAEDLFELSDSSAKPKMVLNFEKVEYLSSAVLGKLVALQKRVTGSKGTLHLCCIRESIQQVFKVTRLDKVLKIYPDQAKAVKAFKGLGLFGKR